MKVGFMQLSKRQNRIFEFIQDHQPIKRLEIESFINLHDEVSKITIIRDLDVLLEHKLIKKTGQARSIVYSTLNDNELLEKYNVEKYFESEVDNRVIKYP